MSLTAFLHGYPPYWSMGGEVSTHRTLRVIPGATVVSNVPEAYELDGVRVVPLESDLYPSVVAQAEAVGATALFAHSTLSAVTARAARRLNLPSVLAVHAPPRYSADLRRAWTRVTARLYNTETARQDWNDPKGWLLHPPAGRITEMPDGPHDALVSTSSLLNKGVTNVLRLAKEWPHQRFIIVESPAHETHGSPNFWSDARKLPNLEVWRRMRPDGMGLLWAETKVLMVPSRYETYGMSAVEAAFHGIPAVHVDTPHVREGIGEAARLLKDHTWEELARAVREVLADYDHWSTLASVRAEFLVGRELRELYEWRENVSAL